MYVSFNPESLVKHLQYAFGRHLHSRYTGFAFPWNLTHDLGVAGIMLQPVFFVVVVPDADFFLYDTHAQTHKCIITGDRAVTLTITQSDQSPKAQNQPEQIRLHSFKDPDTVMNI